MLDVKIVIPLCTSDACQRLERVPRAEYLAGMSSDGGRTVEWALICGACAPCWNDGGDWLAPLYPLGEPFVPEPCES